MSKSFFLNRRLRPVLLAVAVLFISVGFLWQSEPSSAISIPVRQVTQAEPDETANQQSNTSADASQAAKQDEEASRNQFEVPSSPASVNYEIKSGDTLSEIFEEQGISAQALHQLLEADAEFLALETIQPGTQLTFRFGDDKQLLGLELQLDKARTVSYSRENGDGSFEHEMITQPLHWATSMAHGSIEGSFYASGLHAGLSKGQVVQVSQLLKSKLNFRRDLRAGDTFSVIVGREMTTTEATGNTRIEGIALHRGSRTYYAFLYSDGNYYDQTGDSVTPAFLRWPTKRHYRVTSPFDPTRMHPITHRHAPHNGVDLGTPSGTVVMSTGDGIVSRIGNHPYAGKYVEVEHSGAFKTRYLHLSKILVKRGEAVKRGEKIALSGATGRVTGPHLHFEFHIKRHPVNPLTAKIPTSARVPTDKMAAFKTHIRHQMARLNMPAKLPTKLARGDGAVSPSDDDSSDWTKRCARPGQCRFN